MRFEEALATLRKGKKISLRKWEEKTSHMFNINVIRVCLEEILSEDWVIVEEEEEGKPLSEVFEDFKAGKKIRRKCWFYDAYIHKDENGAMLSEGLLANDWEVVG